MDFLFCGILNGSEAKYASQDLKNATFISIGCILFDKLKITVLWSWLMSSAISGVPPFECHSAGPTSGPPYLFSRFQSCAFFIPSSSVTPSCPQGLCMTFPQQERLHPLLPRPSQCHILGEPILDLGLNRVSLPLLPQHPDFLWHSSQMNCL